MEVSLQRNNIFDLVSRNVNVSTWELKCDAYASSSSNITDSKLQIKLITSQTVAVERSLKNRALRLSVPLLSSFKCSK